MKRFLDRLIDWLQRVTCKRFGHEWRFLSTLGENAKGHLWLEEECARCRSRRQRSV